jgi:hypothetical protein
MEEGFSRPEILFMGRKRKKDGPAMKINRI